MLRRIAATASAATLAAFALTLVGCTPPEPVEDPTVIWESDGTSPLESDPAIEAVRAADLAYKLAFNTLDFSRSDFVAAYSPSYADDLSRLHHAVRQSAGGTPRVSRSCDLAADLRGDT